MYLFSGLICLGMFTGGFAASATEVVITTGISRGTCESSDQDLLIEARNKAEVTAGQNFTLVSKWNQLASTVDSPEGGGCLYKRAWAEALFVIKSEINEVWYLTVAGDISNQRVDWTIPGENVMTDEEAWQEASNKALTRARMFCSDIAQPFTIETKKKIFPWNSWYDNFSVQVRLQCLR